jgi:hypothetical protein
VSGAVCFGSNTPHNLRSMPRRDWKRRKSTVDLLQGRLIVRAGGALRASRGKPSPHAKPNPQSQPKFSDFWGRGGTHDAWQAAVNGLILSRIQLYDDFASSSCTRLTALCFHCGLSSSLAGHEGQAPQYKHFSPTAPLCRPIAANSGACHAA